MDVAILKDSTYLCYLSVVLMSGVFERPLRKEPSQQGEMIEREHSGGTGQRTSQKVQNLYPRQDPRQWSLHESGMKISCR